MDEELREHMIKSLDSGIRLDGRKPLEYRNITVESDVVTTAEGSARAKIGDTEVLVGIKMETGVPYPDIPDQGTMMVGAELLPMSNPQFELGPPGIQAIELDRKSVV
jgi:exosome complex component RRP42